MKNPSADMLVQEADKLVRFADEEIQRAEEDVITHSVCFNARQSIINYLASFLHRQGVEPVKPVTMAGLLEQCQNIDGRFNLIDISEFGCKHDDKPEAYCLGVDKVADCLRIAKQTRAIAVEAAPAY
ncbi:MAG: hypothetical protein GVY26_17830 [Bacteroidetes bacterium]|jgi:hypothetical protein|nr:hypothetical protein [Bacteroidota bacterium]